MITENDIRSWIDDYKNGQYTKEAEPLPLLRQAIEEALRLPIEDVMEIQEK